MKRFVISEDERRRILSMHESATKRQYLSEQPNAAPQPQVNPFNQVMGKLTAEMPDMAWMKNQIASPSFVVTDKNAQKLYDVINKYKLVQGVPAPALSLNGGNDFFTWVKSISPKSIISNGEGNIDLNREFFENHINYVFNFADAVGRLARAYLNSDTKYKKIEDAVEALKSDVNAKKNEYFASGNDQALQKISNALRGYLGQS